MTALMVLAAWVSVAQLAMVASWSRSLRVGTLFGAVGLGVLACGPAGFVLEWAGTRGVAAVSGAGLADVVGVASWSFDPVVEECVKIAPLVWLAWHRRGVYRQFGWADSVLFGAGLGMGFELCEALLRYGSVSARAGYADGWWVVDSNLLSAAVVPDWWVSLSTWQPAPASYRWWFDVGGDSIQHLAWTGLCGAGVAWFARRRGRWRWLGAAPLAWACVDHANYNGDLSGGPLAGSWASQALLWVGEQLPSVLIVVLLASVVADRVVLTRARQAHPGVLLPGERPDGLSPGPVWRALRLGGPWSLLPVWGVVLGRRAALYGGESELVGRAERSVALVAAADDREAWRSAVRRVLAGLSPLAALRSWRSVLWLAGVLPALAYTLAGGFPATRDLQEAMGGPAGFAAVAGGWALASAVAVSLIPGLWRALRRLGPQASADSWLRLAAGLGLRVAGLACGCGLVAAAVAGVDLSGPLLANDHLLDAVSSASLLLGLALIAAAFVLFPPGGMMLVTSAGTIVLSETAIAWLVTVLAGTALVEYGILEMAANGADGSGGSSGSGSGSGADPGQPPTKVTGYREHSIDRLEQRGITRADVEDIVDNPDRPPEWQPLEGTWLFARGKVRVAVRPDGIVVTSFIKGK